MAAPTPLVSHEERYLRWIAVFSLCKGILLCLLAGGLLGFLHRDIDVIVGKWISLLGMNMENRHVIRLLARLDHVTDKQVAEWSGITFAVAGVFVAEGTGLLLRQQWAKYLTVVATSSLIPIEIMESARHFGWLRIGLLIGNLAVVSFLVASLLRDQRRTQGLLAMAPVPNPGCEPV